MIDKREAFLDSLGGGAWPFRVGGLICQVDSDNERDPSFLVLGSLHSVGNLFG